MHWRPFIEDMLFRGLSGVKLIVNDDHKGLKAALKSCLSSIPWQRCIFNLCQNAQSYSPSVHMRGEIAQAVKDIYQAPSLREAREKMKEIVGCYE